MDVKINHVAIILDGNGRWAIRKGLKRSLGHKAGFNNLKKLSRHVFKKGVKILSVFAFSTENFKREKEEVDYLMNLLVKNFKSLISKDDDVKIIFSGRRENLSDEVNNAIDEIEKMTEHCEGHIFNICFNYGGRADIIDAAKNIALEYKDSLIDINDIDENYFKNKLYNSMPDIDLLIRTGGEKRISNFMLFQLSYAELYFTDTLFPDFNSKEFDKALLDFSKRDRRYGGIKNKN